MKYKIRDKQFSDKPYFADGKAFDSEREVCEQLISYHSIDCDMSEEQALLDAGKVDECLDRLRDFEWEIEEELEASDIPF
jgi:hypothetical protein